MTNAEVINEFINGSCKKCSGGSVSLDGNCLYSFNTCISQRMDNGMFLLNSVKYTITTTRHESMVKKLIPLGKIIMVDNVPSGARDLISFYKNGGTKKK